MYIYIYTNILYNLKPYDDHMQYMHASKYMRS